jgi:hypothetical protein
MMCGTEIWVENISQKNKLQAVEMDYLRRSARKTKLEFAVRSKEINASRRDSSGQNRN